MYILYPWFMPILFILAGIGAKYALEKHSAREWFAARTRKLLVPSTIGLLVFQWMTGYFNTHVAGTDVIATVPQPFKFFMWAISGIGPLWFIQDLWLFSIVLLLLRKATGFLKPGREVVLKDWVALLCIVALGVLFWVGEMTLIFNPRPESADGLYNLYKPFFYLIPFLLGYYLFSYEKAQELLSKAWIPLMGCAVASGAVLVLTTFGQNNTIPQYLSRPLNSLYGWLMCLAMIGWFKARFDRTNAFAAYMTRSSYGLYIVHYLVVASFGYMMKFYTQLPPIAMYAILTVAVFTLSPLIYELLHRIPVVRWCVFGESGPVSRRQKS